MVDEYIVHRDMSEMSLDGIFECSRESHSGRPRGARAGRCDDHLAFTMRSSRRESESFDAWRGAARALRRGGADEARESLCGNTVGASRVQENEWHLRSAYRKLILGEKT
mmetsp:Transcript_45612/g.130746  ORF Transcript_45612/g.130746 Transcript_45612/m.130746 type:complete len:110 (+) Transcript_45612:935-1264(+)